MRKRGRVCMETYDVVFSDEAKADLLDIVDYLNNFSIHIGVKYLDEIQQTVFSLAFMPQRCPFVRDDDLRQKGYRWIFVRNYTIFFVIDEAKRIVDIRAIMYSGREYTALL